MAIEIRLLEYFFDEEYKKPKNIHISSRNSKHMLNVRIGCFIYLTAIYLWALTGEKSFTSNIIYLTMQGYYLTWLYFGLTLQDYILNQWGNKSLLPKSRNLRYVTEVTCEMAFCAELPITLIFWGFLFKILIDMPGVTTQIIIQNANLHAGPLICLIIDMIYNPFTFKSKRYRIVFLFGCLYMLINMAYTLSVHVIYRPIDWVSWLSYVLILSSFVLTFFCHFIGRFIYRKFKKGKIPQEKQEKLTEQILNSNQGISQEDQRYQIQGSQPWKNQSPIKKLGPSQPLRQKLYANQSPFQKQRPNNYG